MLVMMPAQTATFSDPGVSGEGGLGLLHEAAGQQLEGALLEAVRPEKAAADGADVDWAVHRLPRSKEQLQCTPMPRPARTWEGLTRHEPVVPCSSPWMAPFERER